MQSQPRKPKKTRSDKLLIPDNFYSQLESMAGLGLNGQEISQILGMSVPTFERRKSEDPLVTDALRRGRAKARAQVAKTAYQMATSGKSHPMTQFWLKCKGGWHEKQEISLSYLKDKFGVTDVNKLTDEQRIELAEKCIVALRQGLEKKDDELEA